MINKKYLKIISIILPLSLILTQLTKPWLVNAQTLPSSPSLPSLPSSPVLPANSTPQPTPLPVTTPKPSIKPTPLPVTTPPPSPSSYPLPVSTETAPSGDFNQTANGQVSQDAIVNTGDATNTDSLTNIANINTQADSSVGSGSSISAQNSDNGADSQNSSTINQEASSTTVQDNQAEVVNSLSLDTDTGNNSASKNTGVDSSITTGDSNTSGTIVNFLNTNIDGVMVSEFNIVDDPLGDIILDFEQNCISGCQENQIDLTNSDNGADSQNNSEVNLLDDNLVFQNNDIIINNELVLTANTGNNTASSNTNGDSSITTGDANVSGNIINFLNNNLAGNVIYGVINIFDTLTGDLIIPEEYLLADNQDQNINLQNSDNGSETDNSTSYSQTNNQDLNQFNSADINNDIELIATTGDNNSSSNTDGSIDVKTGNTSIDGQILNIANNNFKDGTWWIALVNNAGEWFGQIIGAPQEQSFAASQGTQFQFADDGSIDISNSDNGAGSTNSGEVTEQNSSQVTQTNTATVNNTISLSANTGSNDASRNTGGHSEVSTGDANAMLNMVNFINNNFSGGNVLLTIVNVFGSWFGDLLPPGIEKPASSSDQLALQDQPSDSPDLTPTNNNQDIGGSSQSSTSPNSNNQSQTSSSSNPSASSNTTVLAAATANSNSFSTNFPQVNFFQVSKEDFANHEQQQGLGSNWLIGALTLGFIIQIALITNFKKTKFNQ